ncbi:adenylate/guanylate cyclase domain-containing protein [Bacteroidota bacterium]
MEDRRHIAVMFTDIVGYTSLMGSDEDKAFNMLKRNHTIHATLTKRHNGKLIKEVGDGTLVSFPLASDAVRCAMDIQKEAKSQNIPLKIGIHQGEMVMVGADVLGDGVNVASRLQESAEEGCISISGAVYRDVKNKAGITTEFLEDKTFKNVDEPVKVYRVHCEKEFESEKSISDQELQKTSNRLPYYIIAGLIVVIIAVLIWQFIPSREAGPPSPVALVDKEISIAVLPFDNLSGDPEQEAMCDGLTEEIIHHLSIIKDFDKVISRNSSMAFKNTDKTTPEIAEILGVDHILEGSYRESGERLRITAQLIEAATDRHLWSEIYERPIGDIFDIQSDIAKNIAISLNSELTEDENQQLTKVPTQNMEAYQLFLQALHVFTQFSDLNKSITLCKQAISLDPNFAEAYSALSSLYLFTGVYSGDQDMKEAAKIAKMTAYKAIELDPNLGYPYYVLSMIHVWSEWDYVNGIKDLKKSLTLSPEAAYIYQGFSDLLIELGRFKEAFDYSKKGFMIDPLNSGSYSNLSSSYLWLKDYNNAIRLRKEAISLFGGPVYEGASRFYLRLDSLEKSIIYLQKHHEWWMQTHDREFPRWLSTSAIAYAKSGDLQKAQEYLEQLKIRYKESAAQSPEYFIALYYGAMGQKEETFTWLEIAYQNKSPEMPWLKVEPYFQFLKDDPRYWDLYEKVGFKAYDEYMTSINSVEMN